jgi:hypothetical protein
MLLTEDISDIELKQRWRLYWIHCIFEFSNSKLQRMSWVEGAEAHWPNDEGWPSSFDECMTAYFDTLALDDAYLKAIKAGNVSLEEAKKANTFHMLALLYDEPSENPNEILNDTEWIEVVQSAKEFWNYLKSTVTSQREIDLMKKLEKDYF